VNDFNNPRIPPNPGDAIYLASSETLSEMLSPKRNADIGSAHIGSLLTRKKGEVPVVLSIKDVVSTHLAIWLRRVRQILHGGRFGRRIDEPIQPRRLF
jgi:DNA helicase HerA-like ATPase